VISEAVLNDAAQIVELWNNVGLMRPWNDPNKDIELSLAAESSMLFKAQKGNVLIGTVMAGYDGHRGWIYYLAVDPAHQKQGVGRKLYDTALDWLKEKGAPKVQILIRADNTDVVSFYEALGFEKSTSVLMGKPIDAF